MAQFRFSWNGEDNEDDMPGLEMKHDSDDEVAEDDVIVDIVIVDITKSVIK